MSKIRIGVLGCASIAKRSAIPALLTLTEDFELSSLASRTRSKAESFSQLFHCEVAQNYADLICSEDIDAIYLPLPTGLHYRWIMKAIEYKKHVYAEKSFAMSFSEAQEIVDYASHCNVALMEGYMFIYHHQNTFVKERIRQGEIGEIRHFNGRFGFPPLDKKNFRYDEIIGGGALMDAAGYPLRAAHFIAGNELRVASATLYRDPATSASLWGSAMLQAPNGVGASISFGFDNYYQCNYEVWGSAGKIIVPRAYTAPPDMSPVVHIENNSGARTHAIEPCNHFAQAFKEFARAISKLEVRQNHYASILLQSFSQDRIRALSD